MQVNDLSGLGTEQASIESALARLRFVPNAVGELQVGCKEPFILRF